MDKYIDKKILVTTVIALVAVFFLQKWFTKSKLNPVTGATDHYVGHDAIGHI
jgi:hypothetical protein